MGSWRTTRRGFLQQLAGWGAGVYGLSACQTPPSTSAAAAKPPETAPSRALLSASDFRFVGACRLPDSVSGEEAAGGRALALRRVGGELRLLSTTVKHSVYEVRPRFSPQAPYPLAEPGHFWGDVYHSAGGQNLRLLDSAAASSPRDSEVYGLYWDEGDQRLYWSYGDGYNTVSALDPSLGYSILNDQTGLGTALGVGRLAAVGWKASMGGVLAIPAWFAERYCAGQRLGAGFGGYFSIATIGPVSMGPALCAFAPPAAGSAADLLHTPLLGYPFNAQPYTSPQRAERDADYHSEFDGWNPQSGVGYWTWADWLWQGAVWIDTPQRHGLLFFPTLAGGRTWYETSTLHAERASHQWWVYDPADLGRVASGTAQRWQIQAAKRWPVRYPGQPSPLSGWSDEPRQM